MSQPTHEPQQQHPYQTYQQPPQIVIHNSTSSASSASAAATAGGMLPRKRHSVGVHVALALLTGGLGNIVYWWMIASENKKRGY